MKKILTLFVLGGFAFTANGQQINGDFDDDWHNCTPWTSTNNTKTVSAQPDGWHISNVVASTTFGSSTITVGGCVDGSNGTRQAVKLTNQDMLGQKIPGYLTLGTPWATAEVKGSEPRQADGGVFGGLSFSYHPDAISFDYKRDDSKGSQEPFTVVAYLWKGQWTQTNVPGNTIQKLASWPTATKTTMYDRDRNILGISTLTGDANPTSTEGSELIAKIISTNTGNTNDEWQSKTLEFEYSDKTASVEKLNVIFSATDYFGDRNGIVGNNSLTIDNVKLVYYHALNSLSTTDANGNPVALNETFNAGKYNYTVNAAYDEFGTEVNYDVKGVGAKAEESYDEDTQTLTITVKGEDYNAESNPNALTTYTIKYKKAAPTLSSLVVAGHEFIAAGNETKDFTASGKYYADELSYTAATEGANVETSYDNATGKLTVALSEEDAISNTVYTVTFEGKQKDAVYQIPNADFDNWGETSLSEGWNSFEAAVGQLASFASMSPAPEKIDGVEGNGVRLTSKDLWIAYANGNLTTGHINMGSTQPADASNFNFTDRTDVNGNLPFAGTPDAFEVYARFTPGTAKTEGTELNGRVQLILHGEAAYHDPELDNLAGNKIASASVLVPATAEWTKFTGEFNYTGNESDKQYLLASATTNPVPGASKDDQLDLDNLKLVYYHALNSLTFDGNQVEGFASDKTAYTLDVESEVAEAAEKIAYEVKGRGASAEKSLNGNVLTITVKGNDFEANAESKTVYTVTFNKKVVDGIGSISADEAKNHKVYTLGGVRVNGKPAAGVYVVDGKKVTVK